MDAELKELLKKWREGALTAAEAEVLLSGVQDPARMQIVEAWLLDQFDLTARYKQPFFSSTQKALIYKQAIRVPGLTNPDRMELPQGLVQVNLPRNPSKTNRIRQKRFMRLCALVCILVSLVYFLFNMHRPQGKIATEKQAPSAPLDKAAPVLATPTIRWGSQAQGVSVEQAIQAEAARLHKDKTGCLVFTATQPSDPPSIVTVPRGSRPVQLMLPDGSKVWLNTGSSLKFPGAFEGSKRTVTLKGEAYFEVVHNPKQVFEVHQGANTISVLGTHFNINGYAASAQTKVTLLEGLVEVNHLTYLHPAQQAILKAGHIQIRKDIDLKQVMAWKNNQFYFNGTSAEQILSQLSRWYNIEIVYKGSVPQGHYSGIISKDNNLSQVLAILEAGGMKFKLNQQSLWIY